jgi:hypothetical protein
VRPIRLELCVLHQQDTSNIPNGTGGKQEVSLRNFPTAIATGFSCRDCPPIQSGGIL